MSTIVKSFTISKTPRQIESIGTKIYCSWQQLLPYLGIVAGIAKDEIIDGFVADEKGMEIKISQIINQKN
jgi:hypothetical protein